MSTTTSSYVHRVIDHLRVPLYRNGYMLMISSGASSALGVLYWILAARFYTAEDVGINSSIIAAMTFLSSVSLLSLNNVLVRYLPVSGRWTSKFVASIYGISFVASLVAAAIFLIGINVWTPHLTILTTNIGSVLFWLLALTGANIFTLQDGALTGLRKTWWIPIENIVFSMSKIALLCYFALARPTYGIYLSWVVPLLVMIVPINYLIFSRLLPNHQKQGHPDAAPPSIAEITAYVGGNFIGSTCYFAYTTLVPLIVVGYVGAATAAFFYIPWTITVSLYLVALNMSTALTVEVVRDRSNLAMYYGRVVRQCLRLLVPVIAVIVLAAPYILAVFGPAYAEQGTTLFRLTALAVLPGSITLLYIGVLRAQNRVRAIALTQATICVSILLLSALLLDGVGIVGVGWAVVLSQSLVALGVVYLEWGHHLRQRSEAKGP
jgi:O-antigen/teichoic acid export membrane protein